MNNKRDFSAWVNLPLIVGAWAMLAGVCAAAAIPVGLLEYNPTTGTKKVFPVYADGSGEATQNANFNNTKSYVPISASVSGTEYQVAACYDDPSEYLVILIRSKSGGTWGSWTSYIYDGTGGRPTIQRSATDNHNTIGLGIDPNGYLHIAYDHHDVTLKYRRSDAALNSWTGGVSAVLTMLGTNESSVSYPHFFNDPTGVLYFMFRDGASGAGDTFIYKYTHGTTSWAGLGGTTAGKVINGKGSSPDENAYPFNCPKFTSNFNGSGTGFMYLAWAWCETTSATTRHDLSMVRWDGTTNWTTVSGSAQTIPVTHENANIVDAIAQSMNFRGGDSLMIDSSGYPHLVYKTYISSLTTVDAFWHNYWNGSAWTKTRIDWGFTNDYDFSIHDAVIDSSDQIYLITTNKGMGNGVYCYTSPGTNWGKTWKLSTITDEDVRIGADGVSTRAAIQIDPYQWRVNGVIQSLVPLTGDSAGVTQSFPSQWTYADKATITNPASATDNPFFIIDASRLSARFWANCQSDLDDVRLSDGNGNMLPCYVHVYNYGSNTGMIFGRWVGTLASSGTQEVWVHYGNVSATTPAATHILGRNNCWRDTMSGMYIDGDTVDYSRLGNTLTATGAPTTGIAGPFGTLKASDVNGSSQYFSRASATITAAPTASAIICWFNSDTITVNQCVAGITYTGDTDRYNIGMARGAVASDPVSAGSNQDGGASVFGDSASGYLADTWYHAGWRFASTSSRQTVLNGVAGTAETSTRAPTAQDCLVIGALRLSSVNNYFDGSVSMVQFYTVNHCPSADEIAHQYAMANQAAFWGTWQQVGGSARPQVIISQLDRRHRQQTHFDTYGVYALAP